jgi:hypothetical protein
MQLHYSSGEMVLGPSRGHGVELGEVRGAPIGLPFLDGCFASA